MDKIIALVSGLDSFCYLGQYIEHHKILVLRIDYGQSARYGFNQMALLIASLAGNHPNLSQMVLDIDNLRSIYPEIRQVSDIPFPKSQYDPRVAPPLRNTIFVSIAMAYAKTINAERIIMGSTIDDSEGFLGVAKFPDLARSYLFDLEGLLQRGSLSPVEIWSPARQGMSKAKNLKLGYAIWEDLVYETWSCHLGGTKHCGECFGCVERKRVFSKAKIVDRTEYMSI